MIGMQEIDPATESDALEEQLGVPRESFPVLKQLGMIVYKTINGKFNVRLPDTFDPENPVERMVTTQHGLAKEFLLKRRGSCFAAMIRLANSAHLNSKLWASYRGLFQLAHEGGVCVNREQATRISEKMVQVPWKIEHGSDFSKSYNMPNGTVIEKRIRNDIYIVKNANWLDLVIIYDYFLKVQKEENE